MRLELELDGQQRHPPTTKERPPLRGDDDRGAVLRLPVLVVVRALLNYLLSSLSSLLWLTGELEGNAGVHPLPATRVR